MASSHLAAGFLRSCQDYFHLLGFLIKTHSNTRHSIVLQSSNTQAYLTAVTARHCCFYIDKINCVTAGVTVGLQHATCFIFIIILINQDPTVPQTETEKDMREALEVQTNKNQSYNKGLYR